jgi:hypothetical protein
MKLHSWLASKFKPTHPERALRAPSRTSRVDLRNGKNISPSADDTPRRGIVISNCQCLPIASWLTTLSAHTVFDFWGVHLVLPEEMDSAITTFIDLVKSQYDLVLTIPLSDDYLGLSTERITETFSGIPVIRISNIYFSGLHPDLTYLGGLGHRVLGPLSDYHSRLAIQGFQKGLSVENTMPLFCEETYKFLGYYDEYERSLNTLRERDRVVDVPVADILADRLKVSLCLFSVNHPTSALLSVYCDRIVHYLERKGLGCRSDMPANAFVCSESLAQSAIFPIYPEIADHHGIPYFGSDAFKPEGSRVNAIDLFTFVKAEFEAFAEIGRTTMAQSLVAQQIASQFASL